MSHVLLSSELTIDRIAEAKELLEQALMLSRQERTLLEIDLRQVTDCDASGLQLLLATARSAQEMATTVTLRALSPALAHLLNSYHLADRFVVVKE